MSEQDGIGARLGAEAERLADLAIELLRAALHTDDPEEQASLRAQEKRVTRARRSVEKAVALLDGGPSDDD